MKELYSHELKPWQKFLQKTIGMWRVNADSIDFKWGYFSPKFGLTFLINRGFYEDDCYSVSLCLIWGYIHVKLPVKTSLVESFDWPKYGFSVHGDTLWFYTGLRKPLTWDLPIFSWVFEHHMIKSEDGEWVLVNRQKKQSQLQETHPYTYKLNSGKIQQCNAKCSIEKRQWHRKWLPFIKIENTTLNVGFDKEIGEGAGSWKGGTLGCSYDINKGESIFDCIKRMERDRSFAR